jgi:phosphopantothenoylcysteine synthetase/decarboxylase
MTARVLYIITCAAPPAREVSRLVLAAKEQGWDVCVISTPSAVKFLDTAKLESQTGHPVRHDYKDPADPDALPEPDAIIVAPATVNTINKWGAGICDTLPLGIIVEAIGKRLPVVALPFTNYAQAMHPAFEENIRKLRSWGVEVLYGPDIYPLHAPGTGDRHLDKYPWSLTLRSLEEMINIRSN